MQNTLYSNKTLIWNMIMRAVLLFSLFVSFSIQANTVANIEIPDTIPHSNQAKNLLLNGAGIRTKFIFDIYVGALYLEKKLNNADAIYTQKGEKRVSMHFLYDEISKEKLTNAWSDGFNSNHSSEELEKLNTRITQFNNLFTPAKKGDVINLNFIPGKGTTVVVNNKQMGTVKGDDFFTAVLKIWLGEQPADSDLKNAMLGQIEDQ